MKSLQAHHWTAWLIFGLIVGFYLTLAAYFPVVYIRATYEDWYGEWTQFYLFLTVTLTSAWLVFRCRTPYRRFFIVLMLASFFTVGEEISWGQRLMNIESPEFFEEHNIQGETNIHNFFSGPVSALSKDIVEWVLAIALWTFGLFYPLLLRMQVPLALRAESLGLAPCPLYVSPFFLLAAPLEMGIWHFNLQEIGEILVGTGLVCMNFYYIGHSRSDRPAAKIGALADASETRWVSASTAGAFAMVLASAFMTTRWVYSNPRMADAMEHRLHHGMLTFAERYENIGFHAHATGLYERAHDRWPERIDILRWLTQNYKTVGNEDAYMRGYRELLERVPDKPFKTEEGVINVVEFNLLRAESFKNIGDDAQYAEHMRIALEMAEGIAEFRPDDADAAYWLGRVHQKNGDFEAAVLAYQRAVELDPESKRFAAALISVKRKADKLALQQRGA